MADPIEIKLVGKDESSKALESASAGIKDLGTSAEKTAPKLKGVGEGMSGMSDKVRRSSKDSEEAAGKLDRMGEAGGNAESQFLGLGAGISGVSTLMKGGSLSAEEMAMATADIGDSIEHTVVPWLGKGRDAVAGFVDRIGGVKAAAIGAAGAAALGALVVAIKETDEAANARNLEQLAERLQASSFAATDANKAMIIAAASMGKLGDQFDRALEAGPEQAAQFIELAEKAGINSSEIDKMRDRLETSTKAEDEATAASEQHSKALETEADRIRGVSEARQAATDPVFAVIDALRRNEEAQRALDEAEQAASDARKEHGRSSDEYADAVRGVEDAQINAAASAGDMEAAAADLEAQIAEHPATLSNARLALQRWVAQGLISNETARVMGLRFENAANKADEIQGTRTATLNARDNASRPIISVGNRLRDLDGDTATVHIGAVIGAAAGNLLQQAYYLATHAAGGPIGHAAAGGPRGSPVLMHEQGPEIAMHPDGSMVIPAGASRGIIEAAAGWMGGGMGGGPNVNVYVQGSLVTERDLVGHVVQALRDKGLVPA